MDGKELPCLADSITENVLRQCLNLISQLPMLMVYGYHAYNYKMGEELFIYAPKPELSTAVEITLPLQLMLSHHPGQIYTILYDDGDGFPERIEARRSQCESRADVRRYEKEYDLYEMVEHMAPLIIGKKRKICKGVNANVDFYSGLVYSMLDLPPALYAPIFAAARIVGWSAHRLEELKNVDKIIRPAYKPLAPYKEYVKLEDR